MNTKRVVLVVEDNLEEVVLLRESIRRAGAESEIQVVTDGDKAIQYLSGAGQFEDREKYPIPGTVFLDLKMPKVNGFEVLRWLKEHEDCKVIPVIVLTSSAQERDVMEAYQLGANCYIKKPIMLDELARLIRLAFEFWSICEIPPLPQKCRRAEASH